VEDYDVVIVGAGIGGLALGSAIESNGRKVCLLEAKPGVAPSKRGLTLQPNGLEALQQLGLLDRVVRIGAKISRVTWREIGGRPLATFDYSILEHPHNYLLTVVPSELELVLRDAFSDAGGTIYESTFFREIRRTGFEKVELKAERDGSPVELSARIIVGADGQNSRVRQALKMPVRLKEYPDHFFFMLAGPVVSLQREARQYLARGRMVGFYPTLGSTYVFYYLPSRKVDEFRAQGFQSFKKELASIEPEVSDSLVGFESWDDIAHSSDSRVDAETWVADQAALLGDAVHALDPSWAQGANLALQDAVALARTIQRCFDLNDFSAKALKRYEEERRQQTEFVQNGAERTAQLTATESRFYHWLGKRILVRTGRNRELMRLALQASCGLVDHFTLREKMRFLI
jgi:2-polyprenyl-6-methoxyphenol hydroxylase-like FAD-dependent oxidoreductase